MGLSQMMKSLVAATVLAGALLGAAPSQAGVMQVTMWQQFASNNIGDAEEQALPTNPIAGGTPVANFLYSGAINWLQSGAPNTLSAFVATGGGIVSNCVGTACASSSSLGNVVLSTGGFGTTSLFRIIFSTDGAVSGNIVHDDGISVYGASGQILNSSFPTSAVTSLLNIASAGTYTLWYVEANGSPSVLNIDTRITEHSRVPEPGALAMVAVALLSIFGFGMYRRRFND